MEVGGGMSPVICIPEAGHLKHPVRVASGYKSKKFLKVNILEELMKSLYLFNYMLLHYSFGRYLSLNVHEIAYTITML